ncbi:MAG: hypothetical protein ACD_12C00871G0001 [uncultured bacterium]|nr:MAG: hypothetical protein ACD_12C00871G0001 [uncultured bacterium]
MKCSKCSGEMEEGLMTNRTISKIPAANGSIVWGTKLIKDFFAYFKVENAKEVKSYRCKECGYLESYAK